MSNPLPPCVFRHPPIHLLDDELTKDNLPQLIAREAERLFGTDTGAVIVKARHQLWEGQGVVKRYVLLWAVHSHGSGDHHRFAIKKPNWDTEWKIEPVEEETKARLG